MLMVKSSIDCIRGRMKLGIAVAVVSGGLSGAANAALLSGTVFSDNFVSGSSSTLDGASQSYPNAASPTATSTNYDVASSKDASASSLNGTTVAGTSTGTGSTPLMLEQVASSSGINQVQAVFTKSAVQLVNTGDAVQLTVTFKNVNSVAVGSGSVDIGLYSSGGSTPYNNLYNGSNTAATNPNLSGLGNSVLNENGGGVQNYVGYESDYFGSQSTKEYQRPAQTTASTNNTDQSLIAPGQTGSYAGPTGVQATYIGQNTATGLIAAGGTYTDDLLITLTAPGTYTLTSTLFSGASDAGTQLGTTTTGTVASLSSGGFDALAIGYRQTANSGEAELDVDSVQVSTNVSTPEPTCLAGLALLGGGLIARRRRR